MKKRMLSLTGILFMLAATGIYAITGDVNADAKINIVDALMIAQYAVGGSPAGFVAADADVNGDGRITIVDALIVAQFSAGLITVFPGAEIPAVVQDYYQTLADGAWQHRQTAVSLAVSSTAGRYTISIKPKPDATGDFLPGDFISAEYEVSVDGNNTVVVHPESFKPVYLLYTELDGDLLMEGLCLLLKETAYSNRNIDYLWRITLCAPSLNKKEEIYIHYFDGIYKISRDTTDEVLVAIQTGTNTTDFLNGITNGVDSSIMVNGFVRPELINPPFFQIDMYVLGTLPGSNFSGMQLWITSEHPATEILWGYLKPQYAQPLFGQGAWLYASIALWYKKTGRIILHDYDPIVMMTKITLNTEASTLLRFTDPDGLRWEAAWTRTSISLKQY